MESWDKAPVRRDTLSCWPDRTEYSDYSDQDQIRKQLRRHQSRHLRHTRGRHTRGHGVKVGRDRVGSRCLGLNLKL